MKITHLDLLSNDTDGLRFDIRATSAMSPYVIRNIAGLDADEIVPRFYGFSKDGSKRFYDLRLPQKEIVILIQLNPRFKLNEDHGDIRDELYRKISATRSGELQLLFHSGAATVAKIYGHIIKFEAGYFSNTPQVQLTIKCKDPMFRGISPVIFEPEDLPSANPVTIVDSISTAPHGFEMEVEFTGGVSTFEIQDKESNPEWDFKVTPESPFLIGDVLHFSSNFTNRYLYVMRGVGGPAEHLLDRVHQLSIWPIIFPKSNSFHFTDIASLEWHFLRFEPAYWGI